MKKMKTNNIIMIVSLLLFIVVVGLIFSMSKIDKLTEETTTLYTATVTGVDVVNTGKNVYAEIQTEEYDTFLYISTNISENISMDTVRKLKNGQTILFRIENAKVQQMNKVEFVNITSLATDTQSVFSLEEYNDCISISAHPARIASIITALLFLFVSLFCYLTRKRQ